jgi:hypothetical protein
MGIDFAAPFVAATRADIRDAIAIDRDFAQKGFSARTVVNNRIVDYHVMNARTRRPGRGARYAQCREKYAAASYKARRGWSNHVVLSV